MEVSGMGDVQTEVGQAESYRAQTHEVRIGDG